MKSKLLKCLVSVSYVFLCDRKQIRRIWLPLCNAHKNDEGGRHKGEQKLLAILRVKGYHEYIAKHNPISYFPTIEKHPSHTYTRHTPHTQLQKGKEKKKPLEMQHVK